MPTKIKNNFVLWRLGALAVQFLFLFSSASSASSAVRLFVLIFLGGLGGESFWNFRRVSAFIGGEKEQGRRQKDEGTRMLELYPRLSAFICGSIPVFLGVLGGLGGEEHQ